MTADSTQHKPAGGSRRANLTAMGLWIALGTAMGLICGVGSAGFLALLESATQWRITHKDMIYGLPLAGFVMGSIAERLGRSIRAGHNLVIDTMHDQGPQIPLRMAPMVLMGTVLTHLFGGSAGREGTAVQMGASLADAVAHRFNVSKPVRRQLLAAGVAGGFGSVFGTPVTGAIFALEFIVLGRIEYETILAALTASIVGDMTTQALGIVHTRYPTVAHAALTPALFLKWLVFAVAVALCATGFIELVHWLKKQGEAHFVNPAWRMMVGGLAVVALWKMVGTSDYLGLSVPTTVRAFVDPNLPAYGFALKLVFTAMTLAAGFLGGEVTPLFVVGACLGNALGRLLGLPLELAVGVGLAAVFASASNTPLSLSIMAVELMGGQLLPHVAIVCVVAYLLAGHRSIYPSQRLWRAKSGIPLAAPISVRDSRPRFGSGASALADPT